MQKRTMLVILTIATSAALGVDAACVDITIPAAVIDSNTTFTPQIAVKNNGSEVLRDVPVSFNVVRASDPADTIYHDTASSGQIGVGETGLVDFGSECSPDPDAFTMTGITELPGDADPHNDTCSRSLFVRHLDVATEVVSPRDTEEAGPVAVQVRLTNMGNVPALVPRLDVTIQPSGLYDWVADVPVGVGENKVVTLGTWVCPSDGQETCTAYITDPVDMYPPNDTDIVVVECLVPGLSGDVGMDLSPSPGLLTGSITRTEFGLSHAGPADVTLFDVKGRAVFKRWLVTAGADGSSLDLHSLSPGIYFVRLDDGRSAVTQKLVVQR